MSKLSDTQLIVLSKAAARDDGCAAAPAKMPRAAVSKVGSSLIARKLMREIRAKPDMPVWREDADNRTYSLIITAAGRKAIGVDDEAREAQPEAQPRAKPAGKAKGSAARSKADPNRKGDDASNATQPRAGSKQALVVDMLSAKAGATIDAMVDATGWLPHTTRAALTGLRKRGFVIARERQPGKNATYRIADKAPTASVAA